MKYKCDKCDQPATNHSIVIIKGHKTQTHLCDLHAAEIGDKSVDSPINELLTNYVKMSGQLSSGGAGKKKQVRRSRVGQLQCPECQMRFREFREKSLLGCPSCYKAFESQLASMLERAHEGGSQHVGKVPHRNGGGEQRQALVTRMRKRLDEAVEAENYELAAKLRDELSGLDIASGEPTTPELHVHPEGEEDLRQ